MSELMGNILAANCLGLVWMAAVLAAYCAWRVYGFKRRGVK